MSYSKKYSSFLPIHLQVYSVHQVFPFMDQCFFFFASPEACRKLYPFLSLPSVCDGSSWLMVELPANIWSFPAVSKLCTKVNCSNWNMEHV